MPISFACPNCGKQTTVADQYAGQSGPCAACGKPITIPFPANTGGMSAGTAAGTAAVAAGGVSIAVILIVSFVVILGCVGVLAALLLPAVQAAREAARRAQSSNNLKQIGLALHNYHDTYNTFPPAVVTDASGKPLYSGRVLLLPYMEQGHIFNSFQKDKAWDSPENQALSQQAISVFTDPSGGEPRPGGTDYVFVTGTGTMFEQGKGLKFADVTDGTSNTIMVVEAKGGYNWAEPRDLDFSQPTVTLDSYHPGVVMVLFGDGSVRAIPKSTPPQQVHQMATRAGGEVVVLP